MATKNTTTPFRLGQNHKAQMRALYRSLSVDGRRQLIDAMKAQLTPEQRRTLQAGRS